MARIQQNQALRQSVPLERPHRPRSGWRRSLQGNVTTISLPNIAYVVWQYCRVSGTNGFMLFSKRYRRAAYCPLIVGCFVFALVCAASMANVSPLDPAQVDVLNGDTIRVGGPPTNQDRSRIRNDIQALETEGEQTWA